MIEDRVTEFLARRERGDDASGLLDTDPAVVGSDVLLDRWLSYRSRNRISADDFTAAVTKRLLTRKQKTNLWGISTMAASLLLCASIFVAIFTQTTPATTKLPAATPLEKKPQESGLATADVLVVCEWNMQESIVTDPKAIRTFAALLEGLSLSDPGVGAKFGGYIQFRKGREVLLQKGFLPEYVLRRAPARQKFFQQLRSLFRKYPSTEKHLITMLANPDDQFRYHASLRLRAGNQTAIPLLIRRIHTLPNVDVRASLCSTLAELYRKHKDERIYGALKDACNDKSPDVRESALKALKTTHGAKAGKQYIQGLHDRSLRVQEAAAYCLTSHPEKDALKRLIELVKSQNLGLHFWAAKALGAYGHPDAMPALLSILKDKKRHHHHFTLASALKKITGKDYGVDAFRGGPSYDPAAQKEAIRQWEWWYRNVKW